MIVDILSPTCTLRLGNRLWVLTEPFIFSVDGVTYVIPRGFVTDGASCPRILWSICSPVAGPFGDAAIPHDWFYNEGPDKGRFWADRVLYSIGRYRGSGLCRAQLVKNGVNAFGSMSYKKNINKVTEKSCYNLQKAKATIMKLQTMPV